MGSSWQAWKLGRWNEVLFQHFFGAGAEDRSPVVVLLVTPEVLASATGDPGADPTLVRDSFVSVVRDATRATTWDILESAAKYPQWPAPPHRDTIPPFVAYLLFTCIAASESSEDLAGEGSFIARLRELSDKQLPETSLGRLPKLWENLATWLALNEPTGRVRQLKLPDPGGLTRIGYTVKLAFPDRRDQFKLSELLDGAGLAGHEPPVGKVLSLVAAARGNFRESFLVAFDEFRTAYAASVTQRSPVLVGHRFWAAVREASLRGRGREVRPELFAQVQVLCEEVYERLHLFIATDEPTDAIQSMKFLELPFTYGQFRFAAVGSEASALNEQALGTASLAFLSGRVRVPRLSSIVDQGVLPFVESAHGILELASQALLRSARVALVRTPLVEDLVKLFGSAATRSRPSPYAGWTQVHDIELSTRPSADLEGTALGRCWMLHDTLVSGGIRVTGGIRSDDGWLGPREVLPRVDVGAAVTVTLGRADGPTEGLVRASEGAWCLPDRDLSGDYVISATYSDGSADRKVLKFHDAPASEQFRIPADAESWLVEGAGGATTLVTSRPLSATQPTADAKELIERVALLGPAVGQFVKEESDATWRVVLFGGRSVVTRCRRDVPASPPTSRVMNASARRKWRRLLLESIAEPGDIGLETARRSARLKALGQLPFVEVEGEPVVPVHQEGMKPHVNVERLVAIISGQAAARTGMSWWDWEELVRRIFNVDKSAVEPITRAWQEAGLLEAASFVRWRHRSMFARRPVLATCPVGNAVQATVFGLSLAATRGALRVAAERAGLLVEERRCLSPFVPSTVTVRAKSIAEVSSVGAAVGLPTTWVDLALDVYGSECRHNGLTPAPVNYSDCTNWSRWSRMGTSANPEVRVEYCTRRDLPDYWAVSKAGSRVWAYDLNTARSWAAALSGEEPVRAVGETDVEAAHAYLPLPLARLLSSVGAVLSGPTNFDDRSYRYCFPTHILRERVLAIVKRTYDPEKLTDTTRVGEA